MTFNIKALMAATALGFAGIVGASPAMAIDYASYDYNNDGYWDESEWGAYSYDTINYNNDEWIDEDEWNAYTANWYQPYDGVEYSADYSFSDYDVNSDGYLDTDEYADAYDSNLFNEWDTDGSGYIEDSEYETAYTIYDDMDEQGVYDF